MSERHIAQMNVGTVRVPTDDPRLAGFMSHLDTINALAEASPGFVWRLQSDQGNATDIILTDNPLFIVNMSVWEDGESLFAFFLPERTSGRDGRTARVVRTAGRCVSGALVDRGRHDADAPGGAATPAPFATARPHAARFHVPPKIPTA